MKQKRLSIAIIVFLVLTIGANVYVGVNQGFTKLSIALIVLSALSLIMGLVADFKKKQ